MTTTKYDLAYGRQGGRIVPWVPVGRTVHPGEKLILTTPGGHDDEVTVESVCDGGRKVDIRFKSGALLRVPVVSLSEVPAHHRHRAGDMDTAVAAAVAATDGLTFNQIAVLRALAAAGEHGMLDHDHHAINGLGQDTAGKRRGELVRAGLVVDSGLRRLTPRGRNAAVWVITPAGHAVLRALQARGAA